MKSATAPCGCFYTLGVLMWRHAYTCIYEYMDTGVDVEVDMAVPMYWGSCI